uniref:Transposase n=1 Tax=Panagrolaimus sp. JU765 TaxID=591449 RepID=A0AC34RH44_9BILA
MPQNKTDSAAAEIRRHHAQARLTKQKIARQLSCAPNTLRTRRGDDDANEMPAEQEKEEAQRL